MLTGASQIAGRVTEYNAKQLGTDYFEVEWHPGARPTHTAWQGKVWSKEQLVSVCGLGTVTGLLGANCYHTYYPFFPGLSKRNWTDDWLKKKNIEENTPKSFKGKDYTVYQAKQRQRQMEIAMRAQREKVQLLQKGGADRDEVMLQKAKYQGQLDEYAQFSRKMGLNQEHERIYMDGRGRVATNTKAQNSMFHPEMIKNASKDVAQYKRYKEVLGDSMVSLAEFGRIKYNDAEEWTLFKGYVKSVESGMISPLSGYKNYINTYRDIEKNVVGIETADKIELKEQSKHFIERVIGTMEDPKTKKPRSGVTVDAIKDALQCPIKVKDVVVNIRGEKSQKYIGGDATVSINPVTGTLIQCNPTDQDFVRRIMNAKIQANNKTD